MAIKIDPFIYFELQRRKPNSCEIAPLTLPVNAWDMMAWYKDLWANKKKSLLNDDGTPILDDKGEPKMGLTQQDIYAELTAWMKEQTGVDLKDYEAKQIYEAWEAGDGEKDEKGEEKNHFALFAKKNMTSPIQPEISPTSPDFMDQRYAD